MRTRRELLTFWRAAAEEAPPSPPIPAQHLLPVYVRPPGAVEQGRFSELCERCGACREACPHDVILPLGPAYGDAEGTPAILPRGGGCQLCEDLPCARACPSGALRVIPLAEVRMGTARLDAELCWAAQGQPCDYCLGECPLGEAALCWQDGRPAVVEEACTGCGCCVAICTATPSALSVVPV